MKKIVRPLTNLLITGGCGFMGSAFIRYLFNESEFDGKIVNLDLLTYAGNSDNLKSIENSPRYFFMQGDICDSKLVESLILEQEISTIVHFAAETHVDRSIHNPGVFMDANIRGTFSLLELVRSLPHIHFHQISTDEVYGSLGEQGSFSEQSLIRPNSPYSASKAAADHLVRAYNNTYKLSTTISRSSNNYGPFQHPEKFIPLMISHILEEKPLPVYGRGVNVRDWLFVEDHARSIWEILKFSPKGETYNVGANREIKNLDLLHLLLEIVSKELNLDLKKLKKLIHFVDDRPGHDFRYALNTSKLQSDLHWKPAVDLEKGLSRTISWYRNNLDWVQKTRKSFHLHS